MMATSLKWYDTFGIAAFFMIEVSVFVFKLFVLNRKGYSVEK